MLGEILENAGSLAGALGERLAGASLMFLAAAVALHVLKTAVRARAWHSIVTTAYPDERLRYRDSLGAYLCGIGVNAVVPARAGEVVKLSLVKRRAPGTRVEGLVSTLVTESAFDSVAGATAIACGFVLGWASLGGSILSPVEPVAHHPWLAAGVATTVVAIAAFAFRRVHGKARTLLHEAGRGLALFGHPLQYLRTVVAWQAGALVLRLGSIACFLGAFHLPVTAQICLVVLAVQCAASSVPLTPNGAGTQQALLVVALGAGIAAPRVVGFGTGAQLATTLADVALGALALALMTGSLRWRSVLTAAEEELPAPAAT
jgi:hypothetical protein